MDPVQAHNFQNNGPDLDPNCLTLITFLKDFFEIVNFEKNQQTSKYMEIFPACKESKKKQTNKVFLLRPMRQQ